MNMRTKSAYGLKGGQQPKGRIRLQPPTHPKFIPFDTQAYRGQADQATRKKPKHAPSEPTEYGSVRSRPKSAVSRRTGGTFSRASRHTASRASNRIKAKDLEKELDQERQYRKYLEKEVEHLRMISSQALSFYKSDRRED